MSSALSDPIPSGKCISGKENLLTGPSVIANVRLVALRVMVMSQLSQLQLDFGNTRQYNHLVFHAYTFFLTIEY